MKTPTHLQHKPIVAVDSYDTIDGSYAGESDAKAISIGHAQYYDAFSAKVFRHTGKKWNRRSEELPLHRVLDLAILLVGAMNRKTEQEPSVTSLGETVVSASDFNALKKYLAVDENAQHLKCRLDELKRLLCQPEPEPAST